MKTEVNEKRIPSFVDMVFEGRNKEYGAYIIRKKYNSTLLWAILAGIFLSGSAVITPFVRATIFPQRGITDEHSIVFIADPSIIPEKIEIQEQKLPEAKPLKEVFAPPKIVDSIPADQTNNIFNTERINESLKDDSLITVITKPADDFDSPITKDIEEPVLVVDEEPSFNKGDANEFRYWVKENLRYPSEAVDNGIQGRVYVQFIIEKDGSVTNVKVIKSDDPLLDKEALRVVQSSPNWIPAKKQGRPVRKIITFPIIFKLNQN